MHIGQTKMREGILLCSYEGESLRSSSTLRVLAGSWVKTASTPILRYRGSLSSGLEKAEAIAHLSKKKHDTE